MQASTEKKRGSRRWLRWVLGLGAVVLIGLLYPNNLTFPYQFEVGQVWRYPDLRAPYGIPVLKPDDVLAADRQAVIESQRPVYRLDPEVARRTRASFIEEFGVVLDSARARGDNRDLVNQSEAHRRYGLEVIDRLYNRGIVRARDEDMMEGMNAVITVVDGNEVSARTLGQLLAPSDTRRWLQDSLFYTSLRAPEVLLDILEDEFEYNTFYSDSLTRSVAERNLATVSPYEDKVQEGELIIAQGETINERIYQELLSYRVLYNENLSGQATYLAVIGGYTSLVTLVVVLLFLYLRKFFPKVYVKPKNLVFFLLWPVLYALLTRTFELSQTLSVYLVPFCIVPIVTRIFFTERLAFFIHVCVVLIASFLTSLGYPFTFLTIMAGVVVIFMDIDTRDWSRYFRSLLLLFVFYLVGYLGLEFLRGATPWTVDYGSIGWLAGNVFLVLLAFPLIPLIERVFGLLSPITLTELSDMNEPLLEKLARQAPGTWQHSLNVANMAEQVCRKIGANALLVKTAALYHDIGKLERPQYFIENQTGANPHDQLTPLESARIIIGHVREGIRLAKEARLPPVLIDFIRTHHGTTRAEYFYRTYVKDHPEREAEEAEFRYPGPRPSTKEQTVMMLADSVEAACKSLKSPTKEELFKLIDNVIRGKLTSGQLAVSQLTFQELEIARSTFRAIMKSTHQLRIAYPDKE